MYFSKSQSYLIFNCKLPDKSTTIDAYLMGLENPNQFQCTDTSCTGSTLRWHHNSGTSFDTSLWAGHWESPSNTLFVTYIRASDKELRFSYASYNPGSTKNVLLCQFDCDNIGNDTICYTFQVQPKMEI